MIFERAKQSPPIHSPFFILLSGGCNQNRRTRPRVGTLSLRLIAVQFQRIRSAWLIVLLWVLLTIPGIFIRGAHLEEGTTAGLARGAFEDGHWLSPSLYGVRWVERPALVSWLLAAVGSITHRIDLWLLRLPATLSILGGALLIHRFVRRRASAVAAGFAATCFLVSPMILQKIVTAEPDTTVSLLLFVALVTWWDGFEDGHTSLFRWIALGCILSVAALVKGPQPLGYFFLGLAAYLLARGKMGELIKLGFGSILPLGITLAWYIAVYQPGDLKHWLAHSRIQGVDSGGNYPWHVVRVCFFIAIESLPGLLLAAALAMRGLWRRSGAIPEAAVVLLFYASACTGVLIFWPGANGRYAMPAVFGIAAAAGFGFDAFRLIRPLLIRSSVFIAAALAFYGITLNCITMPAQPGSFRRNALLAQRVGMVLTEHQWPLYETRDRANLNLLSYLHPPARFVSVESMRHLEPPFWAIMSPMDEQSFLVEQPDVVTTGRLELPTGKRLVQVVKR